jgi:Domain of unknown function (DUF4838)
MKPHRPRLAAGSGDIEFTPTDLGVATAAVRLLSASSGWRRNVRIVAGASPESRVSAQTLVDLLTRMTGVAMSLQEGGTDSALYVGTYAECATVVPGVAKAEGPGDDHVLVTCRGSVGLVGKSALQVERAVWRFLDLLGYRQYMPTPTWEIVPAYTDIRVHLSARESSRFAVLNFAYNACGLMPWAVDPIEDWKRKNLIYGPAAIAYGHAWGAIVQENQTEFDAHPEYVSEVGNKLCVLEARVQEMVTDEVKAKLRANPDLLAASVSAADGSTGWDEVCEGTDEQASFSPSDRQVLLANAVAGAVRQDTSDPVFEGKRVAMLAYGDTSPPPTVDLDPEVIVVVAKSFIQDGLSLQEVYDGYRGRGAALLGSYDYLSVFTWDRNVTGISKVSRPSYWASVVAESLAIGSPELPFYVGEASDATTVVDGLGFWVLARLFYAPDESDLAGQVEALLDDFFAQAFGDLAADMRSFYEMVDGDPHAPLLSTDLLNKMYVALQAARDAASDPSVLQRLDELVLYTRYLELYRAFTGADDATKTDAFDTMMAHVYRIREMHLVHYRCFFYDPVNAPYFAELEIRYGIADLNPYVPTDGNPWPGGSFSDDEITSFIDAGIAANPPLPFEGVAFSLDLVKPTAFDALAKTRTSFVYEMGNQSWYVWIANTQTSFDFTGKAGIAYLTKGDTTVNLVNLATDAVEGTLVLPADRVATACSIPVSGSGLFRLDVVDKGGFDLEWDSTYAVTKVLSEGTPTGFHADWAMYFYVPLGTATIGGYWSKVGCELVDPNGAVALVNAVKNSYYDFPVPVGQDGQIWKIQKCNPLCYLMTVPPQAARSPQELLLPREVVEADQLW